MEKETPTIEQKVLTDNINIEKVYLTSILPYAKNAKLHPESQIKGIMKSIDELGYNDPIALDENNNIIEGHGRFEAIQRLNTDGRFNRLKIIRLSNLTEPQIKAYRIAHNKLSLDTGFDEELLKNELQFLNTDGFDLETAGFTTAESTEILKEDIEIEEDIVEVNAYERAKSKTTIKLGEVYLLGDHRLICGDSTEKYQVDKLMNGEKADMLFTDQPYNVNIGWQNNPKIKVRMIKNDEMSREDFLKFMDGFMKIILEYTSGGIYICMSCKEWSTIMGSFEKLGGHWSSTIIWLKNHFVLSQKDYHSRYEPILYGWTEGCSPIHLKEKGDRKQDDVWEIDRPMSSKLHPTMKPIELCARAIKNSSNKSDIVLDLFGGAGSTLIACEQLSRKCFMMELDPVYCQVIIDRWEKFTEKKAVKEIPNGSLSTNKMEEGPILDQ